MQWAVTSSRLYVWRRIQWQQLPVTPQNKFINKNVYIYLYFIVRQRQTSYNLHVIRYGWLYISIPQPVCWCSPSSATRSPRHQCLFFAHTVHPIMCYIILNWWYTHKTMSTIIKIGCSMNDDKYQWIPIRMRPSRTNFSFIIRAFSCTLNYCFPIPHCCRCWWRWRWWWWLPSPTQSTQTRTYHVLIPNRNCSATFVARGLTSNMEGKLNHNGERCSL